MSELTEFLLARIAEDEAHVDPEYHSFRKTDFVNVEQGAHSTCWVMLPGNRTCILPDGHMGDPARVLAECEAKRRIVEDCGYWADPVTGDNNRGLLSEFVLSYLALPYADHESFKEEWRV